MALRFSPSAIRLAELLRDLNPDIKLVPALERQLGKKQRTVDPAPAPLPNAREQQDSL